MADFQFSIGQVFTVLIRQAEAYSGGFQIYCSYRYFTINGFAETWSNEIELAKYPEIVTEEPKKEGV